MILLCSGVISLRVFDALLLFATGLQDAGHRVAIDDRFVPESMARHQKYEAVPFLVSPDDVSPDAIVMIAAEEVSEESQILLRASSVTSDTTVHAIGYFASAQSQINSCNRLAFATGSEPVMINSFTPHGRPLIEDPVVPLVTAIADVPVQSDGARTSLLVYMPHELLEEDGAPDDLASLGHAPDTDLHILTTARGKEIIQASRHADLSVFGYGELAPSNLLTYADVLAFFGAAIPGERMAVLALRAMGAGKVVIDCTTTSAFRSVGAPALRGPAHTRALSGYLADTIAGNRHEIGRRILLDPWLRATDILRLTGSLGLRPGTAPAQARPGATVFFPTNGVGLGHAQRCALIADALPDRDHVWFAAFPSCTDMLRRRGFDTMPVISRSTEHDDPFAADLVNYLRLRHLLGPQDTLVFDGGYVFDSVYRVVSELKIPAWWIRRGLWQPEHVRPGALERERAFTGVITPAEAFPELNDEYSRGPHVRSVGPVVLQDPASEEDRRGLRRKLAKQFGRGFDKLVVTMLGSGVASERTAQMQMICSLLETRKDCLHLIVTWPHAVGAAALRGWNNSFVIRTHRALRLCQAADAVISAVGYNSFHELLYAGVPAIMIPQHAAFTDDQEKRARSAADRNLASYVAETDLLRLSTELDAFLNGARAQEIRSALHGWEPPATGNAEAAGLISGSGVP